MASLRLVLPLLPGKEEAWRRLYQELSGSRCPEHEESRRRLGITRECVWVAQILQGEIAIVHLEAKEPERVFQQLAASDLPFDRWFRQQLMEFHGFDVTHPKVVAPSTEVIFDWQSW